MGYLYYDENIEVREYSEDLIGLIVKKQEGKERLKQFKINAVTEAIFDNIDGNSDFNHLCSKLAKQFHDQIENVEGKLTAFINDLDYLYGIKIYEVDEPRKIKFEKTTLVKNLPTVAAIELTYACNLKCRHCYGDYGTNQSIKIDFDKAIRLLNNLNKNKIRVIELTGGDITMYPRFDELLETAVSLNFDFIMLLTNGIEISDKVKKIIIDNKERIRIQIDVHSLNEEYLYWFTGKKNILGKIKSNISYLIEKGVIVRVATICTEKNLDELDDIVSWAYNIGASEIGISPVICLGRATSLETELYFKNPQRAEEFMEKIKNYSLKYGDFFSGYKAPNSNIRKNCGAVTSEVVINPEGNLKLCVMDDTSIFKGILGNAIEQDLAELYNMNSEIIDEIRNFETPNYQTSECKECINLGFCMGCMLRTCTMIRKNPENCQWYKTHISPKMQNIIIS